MNVFDVLLGIMNFVCIFMMYYEILIFVITTEENISRRARQTHYRSLSGRLSGRTPNPLLIPFVFGYTNNFPDNKHIGI